MAADLRGGSGICEGCVDKRNSCNGLQERCRPTVLRPCGSTTVNSLDSVSTTNRLLIVLAISALFAGIYDFSYISMRNHSEIVTVRRGLDLSKLTMTFEAQIIVSVIRIQFVADGKEQKLMVAFHFVPFSHQIEQYELISPGILLLPAGLSGPSHAMKLLFRQILLSRSIKYLQFAHIDPPIGTRSPYLSCGGISTL
jgi:hypothetical protein